jgi:hypothetical protein
VSTIMQLAPYTDIETTTHHIALQASCAINALSIREWCEK